MSKPTYDLLLVGVIKIISYDNDRAFLIFNNN